MAKFLHIFPSSRSWVKYCFYQYCTNFALITYWCFSQVFSARMSQAAFYKNQAFQTMKTVTYWWHPGVSNVPRKATCDPAVFCEPLELTRTMSNVHPRVLRFLSWWSSRALTQHSVTHTKNFSTRARPAPARKAVQVNPPRTGLYYTYSNVLEWLDSMLSKWSEGNCFKEAKCDFVQN